MALCENWCVADDLCCEKGKYTDAQIAEAILGASEVLSRSSYNKYGVCDYKVTPYTVGCSAPYYNGIYDSYAIKVDVLAGSPIQTVTNITIYDGDGGSTAVNLANVWWEYDTIFFPTTFLFPTQKAGPEGTPNSWTITLTAGNPIPVVGKLAAIELAGKLLETCGDGECELPSALKSVSRDGSTYELVDSEEALLRLPKVMLFLDRYGQTRKWSGAVSPLKHKDQLIQ